MDYDSLTLQIQHYANRTDAKFVNEIPNFIIQALNRIYYEAKDIGFENVINGYVIQSQPSLQVNFNVNWKETLSFVIRGNEQPPELRTWTPLLPRTYEFCLIYGPTTDWGDPLFYSMRSYGNFYIAPVPNDTYYFEINYLGIPLLNAQNQRNFLTERYPSLLLYACMLEAMSFLKDDERIPVFEAAYNRALQDIDRTAKSRHIDRTYNGEKD